MLIKPFKQNIDASIEELTTPEQYRINTSKNEIYITECDVGPSPVGITKYYDVVLISEMIANKRMMNINEYVAKQIGGLFVKIVHHFIGMDNSCDMNSDIKELFSNMTLKPLISYISYYSPDLYDDVNVSSYFKYDTKTFSKVVYGNNIIDSVIDSKSINKFKTISNTALILDVPDPRYPDVHVYKFGSVPHAIRNYKENLKGSDLLHLYNLKTYKVCVDKMKEEEYSIQRNNSIRALLGTNVDDINNFEYDPLIVRIGLSQMARNIAVDIIKADICGMMESFTAIYDNIVVSNNGFHSAFKSIVSPFNGFMEDFDTTKSQLIMREIDRVCSISKFNDLKGHFRVFINCNQYEITIKIVPDKNLYKNNEAVTVKMRKTEAVSDYIVEHLHKQSVLNNYYSK